LNPNRSAPSAGIVALTCVSLRGHRDLVSLRRDTRAAAEQCGLDERSVRTLSAAAYEAARQLFSDGARGEADIGLSAGGDLLIDIRIRSNHGADGRLISQSLGSLRRVVRVSVEQAGDTIRVLLATAIPAPAARAAWPPRPAALPAAEEPPLADTEAVEEMARLRRALIELQDELTETNRGVVALYAELDDKAERLRQAEERLRVLLDSVHDYAICMLDLDGNVASWNRGAERVLGYAADEIIGRNLDVFYPAAERGEGLPAAHLRAALQSGRFECDCLRVRRGGSAFDALVLLTPVRGGDEAALGFSLVVRDITERKRLEDSLRNRAEQLSAANRAKEDFLATLSHELRTPLNAMLGWTRLLRTGMLDEAGRERALKTIERNAHVQEQLIADILDVSRIITGRLRLDLRPLELAPVVDAAVDTVQPVAAAKGVHLSCVLGPTGTVLGDPARLQQVVWNLLANAIKFTPAGGRVTVNLVRDGASAVITVSDTGSGIPASLLPYVFDRFTQGDVSVTRQHGGLGLGLSIVRHMVELHGGQVSAHSAGPGHGAEFTVRIPLRVIPGNDVHPESRADDIS
jgi:PAS domain S-box-containing protein